MKIKEYRISKLIDGSVVVTPVGYDSRGRGLRLGSLQVHAKDVQAGLDALRVMVGAHRQPGR